MLRIFVGATTDLEAERAVIGRSVAELPIKIGIEIRRTPPLLPTTAEIVTRLDGVDRVYFLMGNDIVPRRAWSGILPGSGSSAYCLCAIAHVRHPPHLNSFAWRPSPGKTIATRPNSPSW